MENKCEMCGSTSFKEVNGIPTCMACGTKFPEMSMESVGIDEKLKRQEIERLATIGKWGEPEGGKEPKFGLLTDDEILKYAPKSNAAKKIRYKRSGKLIDYFKTETGSLILFWTCFIIFFIVLFIFLAYFAN